MDDNKFGDAGVSHLARTLLAHNASQLRVLRLRELPSLSLPSLSALAQALVHNSRCLVVDLPRLGARPTGARRRLSRTYSQSLLGATPLPSALAAADVDLAYFAPARGALLPAPAAPDAATGGSGAGGAADRLAADSSFRSSTQSLVFLPTAALNAPAPRTARMRSAFAAHPAAGRLRAPREAVSMTRVPQRGGAPLSLTQGLEDAAASVLGASVADAPAVLATASAPEVAPDTVTVASMSGPAAEPPTSASADATADALDEPSEDEEEAAAESAPGSPVAVAAGAPAGHTSVRELLLVNALLNIMNWIGLQPREAAAPGPTTVSLSELRDSV